VGLRTLPHLGPGILVCLGHPLKLRTFPNGETHAHLQTSLGPLPYPFILSFLPSKNPFEHVESNFYNHVTRLGFNCWSPTFSDLECHLPRNPPHFIASFSTQMLETHVHKIIILLTIRFLGLKIHVHLTMIIVKCWIKLFGQPPTLHTKWDTNIPKFVRGKYKYHSIARY
jgi:hypothetical protein